MQGCQLTFDPWQGKKKLFQTNRYSLAETRKDVFVSHTDLSVHVAEFMCTLSEHEKVSVLLRM